jgi:beta-mannosidase
MMPRKDWDTFNDDWAMHDFLRGAQRGNLYPLTIAKRYGSFGNTADFVRKSQMANYEGFRAMYEGRFASLFNPVTGILTWMSNPAQNSFVWQIYSHDLEPNSSLFGTMKACEPIHIQMNQTNWHMVIVNSTPNSLDNATAKIAVYNLDSSLAYTTSMPVTAKPDSATDLGEIAFPKTISTVHFVKLTLLDHKGHTLSDNFYWRTSAPPAPLPTFGRRPPTQPGVTAPAPTLAQIAAYQALMNAPPTPEAIWESAGDDFSDLNTMPTVGLGIDAHQTFISANKMLVTVQVTNNTKTIALMAHLQLRKSKTQERVLPVFYSDNFFSLVPGESKSINIEAQTSDLGNGTPEIAVDGWNVEAGNSTGDVKAITNSNMALR